MAQVCLITTLNNGLLSPHLGLPYHSELGSFIIILLPDLSFIVDHLIGGFI